MHVLFCAAPVILAKAIDLENPMLKIALISEHASPLALAGGVDAGGQNIYVANVARHLAEMGFIVDVFTRRDSVELADIVRIGPNLRVIHVTAGPPSIIPKERLLPYMKEFGQFLTRFFVRQAQPYDLMHANFFMSGAAALHVKDTLNLPLVTTFHALGKVRRAHQKEADGFPASRFSIEEELVLRSERIVAECPQDRTDLISLYNATLDNISIAPCGFDSGEFAPMSMGAARASLGWADDEFAILQLGRLVPRKGIDNVIKGLAAVTTAKRARMRLYIVGGNTDSPCEISTPEIARLRRIAEAAGVADKVTFVGRRGRMDLRTYYSAADVFVTTPWYEPFGITPLEAMACGTPVIGSNVGGVQDTVVHERTGLLVPPKDEHALAAALERLFDDPTAAASYGAAGLRRVTRHYTWEHVVESLCQIYEEAVTVHADANRRLDDFVALAAQKRQFARMEQVMQASFASHDAGVRLPALSPAANLPKAVA